MTLPFVMWSAAPFAERCSRLGLGGQAASGASGHVAELRAFRGDRRNDGVCR
jgi:hypothetical protein